MFAVFGAISATILLPFLMLRASKMKSKIHPHLQQAKTLNLYTVTHFQLFMIPKLQKSRQNNLGAFFAFLSNCYGTHVQIISSKAPRNYSDQFGSHKISVLLLEKPKTLNSMFSGLLSTRDPKILLTIYEIHGNMF